MKVVQRFLSENSSDCVPTRLVVGVSQFDGNAGELMPFPWRTTPGKGAWLHTHYLSESSDLPRIDPNASLPLGPSLKVIDRDRLPSDHERTGVRVGEPLVYRGPGNAQSLGRFFGGKEMIGHRSSIAPGRVGIGV